MFTNFEEIQKLSKEQMEAATAAAASVTKGFQTIAAETSEYSKRSLENGSAYLEKLLSARKIEDAVQIQSDFAKTTYEGFVAQTTRIGELYANLARRIPFPIVVDIPAYLEALDRIASSVPGPSHVIPGHDPLVLTLFPREEGCTDIARVDLAPTRWPEDLQ